MGNNHSALDKIYLKISLGPISEVEWVEEVVPVFGKIQAVKKSEGSPRKEEGSKGPLIFLVTGSAVVGAAIWISKRDVSEKEKPKQQNVKCEERNVELQDVQHRYEEKRHFNSPETLDIKCKDISCEVKVKVKDSKEEVKPQIEKDEREKIPPQTVSKPCIKDESRQTVSKPSIRQVEEAQVVSKPQGNPQVKRKWCYPENLDFEEPEWITKIKTFKITKVGGVFLKIVMSYIYIISVPQNSPGRHTTTRSSQQHRRNPRSCPIAQCC